MNAHETEPKSEGKNREPLPAQARSPRVRLHIRPLARDSFATFVYVCLGLLLFGEFFALFWLDLFY